MKKVGLIAGAGVLPVEFVGSAKKKGEKVVVFALNGMASPALGDIADKIYWLDIGQYAKFTFLMVKEGIRNLAFLGKVKKNVIYEKKGYEKEVKDFLQNLSNKKDNSIFEGITGHLGKFGIEVIDTTSYLAHLLPGKGVLGLTAPDDRVNGDIEFGHDIARQLAGMDIGQTVVVKDKTVVAVEAMEGTNRTIERGGEVAGEGCVMVKVGRTDQDMKWDVPTVGPETMKRLVEYKYRGLAIEGGKMYLLEKDEFLKMADSASIAVKVI